MKPVKYKTIFDNYFHCKDNEYTVFVPFWWSDKKIYDFVMKKEEKTNYTSVFRISCFGRIIWEHILFRSKNYTGLNK